MGSFSVQFSTNIDGDIRRYPHDLRGQQQRVKGVDPTAVYHLREGKKADGRIVIDKALATTLANDIKDGARVAAYEKPVYYALIAAAEGKDVKVTDETGHWRPLVFARKASEDFYEGVKGVDIV